MIPGLKWIAVGLVTIVILAIVLIPSGISSSRPNGLLTIYLKNDATGQEYKAELSLGQPTNTMSVFKPVVNFHPLTLYGNQTIPVVNLDRYSFRMSVDFSYGGTDITTFDSARADFYAICHTGLFVVTPTMYASTTQSYKMTVLSVPYSSSLPAPGETLTINTSATDPFYKLMTGTIGQSSSADGNRLVGADLNYLKISLEVLVYGTDINGKAVVGSMDALMTIRTTSGALGSISVTIDSMNASVTPD